MPIAGEDFHLPTVEVRFSYVVELLMAATLVTDRPSSLAGFDAPWQEAQRAILPRSSLDFIERTRNYSCPTLSIVDFAMATGEYDDPDRFLALVRGEKIDRFVHTILNGDLPAEIVAECLADPAAAAGQAGRLSYFSRMPPEDLVALFSDPEGFREALLDFIASNRTRFFESRLAENAPRYEARSREVRERLSRKDPLSVAEEIKKRPFVRRNFDDFFFVPSYFQGFMNITSENDRHFLFLFSIQDSAESPSAEGRIISDRLRVLSDRSRVEILRHLSAGPSFGKEIAARLDLTTATVSRHLDQLKKAGLVIEEKADAQNVKLVRIDREAVEALFDHARGYLCGRGSGCSDGHP